MAKKKENPLIDFTTVAVEKTTRDSINRKKEEFGHERANDTLLELVRFHDMLPDYIETRRDMKTLIDALPEETAEILDDVDSRYWNFRNADICDYISGIRENTE